MNKLVYALFACALSFPTRASAQPGRPLGNSAMHQLEAARDSAGGGGAYDNSRSAAAAGETVIAPARTEASRSWLSRSVRRAHMLDVSDDPACVDLGAALVSPVVIPVGGAWTLGEWGHERVPVLGALLAIPALVIGAILGIVFSIAHAWDGFSKLMDKEKHPS